MRWLWNKEKEEDIIIKRGKDENIENNFRFKIVNNFQKGSIEALK